MTRHARATLSHASNSITITTSTNASIFFTVTLRHASAWTTGHCVLLSQAKFAPLHVPATATCSSMDLPSSPTAKRTPRKAGGPRTGRQRARRPSSRLKKAGSTPWWRERLTPHVFLACCRLCALILRDGPGRRHRHATSQTAPPRPLLSIFLASPDAARSPTHLPPSLGRTAVHHPRRPDRRRSRCRQVWARACVCAALVHTTRLCCCSARCHLKSWTSHHPPCPLHHRKQSPILPFGHSHYQHDAPVPSRRLYRWRLWQPNAWFQAGGKTGPRPWGFVPRRRGRLHTTHHSCGCNNRRTPQQKQKREEKGKKQG